MSRISKQTLREYLHDLLPQTELASVERALRADVTLQQLLEEVRAEEDRGEHTVGAIWRREHITCPTRDELGGYVIQALAPERLAYIEFHLKTVDCPYCLANVEDLTARRQARKK
jgi:hypothetical protein